MKNSFLVITSIQGPENPVLKTFAKQASERDIKFILIGDKKSPKDFSLDGCDYYSVDRQKKMPFKISSCLPYNHYSRKNLGYLAAMKAGADVIVETDDDNYPLSSFWRQREISVKARQPENSGWINIYRYFTDANIWPRGYSLDHISRINPGLSALSENNCPIQQGLADGNTDVDAIYRMVFNKTIQFRKGRNIALGSNRICPFNSQNTTWFGEAFMLMYLPSFCSFRMTDILRSFIAQRIAWTCGWSILFHHSTVFQERNEHNLMKDFVDEIPGYKNNGMICRILCDLELDDGKDRIADNMIRCYKKLADAALSDKKEMLILDKWLDDVNKYS